MTALTLNLEATSREEAAELLRGLAADLESQDENRQGLLRTQDGELRGDFELDES